MECYIGYGVEEVAVTRSRSVEVEVLLLWSLLEMDVWRSTSAS